MRSLALCLGLAALAAGCGSSKYLMWDAKPAAPALAGKLMITVTDKRDEKKGGAEPRIIGMQPGAFAIPTAIRLPADGDVADNVKELLTQASLAAGVGVSPPGDTAAPTGKLNAEVQTFWCAGFFPVFKVNVSASVTLTNAQNVVRVPGAPLAAEGDDSDCRSAYKKVLTQLFDRAVGLLAQPNVKEAALGQGGPPPAQ